QAAASQKLSQQPRHAGVIQAQQRPGVMLFEQVADLTHGEGVARKRVGNPRNHGVESGYGSMRVAPLAGALFAEGFNDVKPGSVNGGDRYQDSTRINLILPALWLLKCLTRRWILTIQKHKQPAGGATRGHAV